MPKQYNICTYFLHFIFYIFNYLKNSKNFEDKVRQVPRYLDVKTVKYYCKVVSRNEQKKLNVKEVNLDEM